MKKLLAMLLALVMAMSMLTIAVFAEPGDVETEPETPADTAEPETPAETGIVLAVLPMAVAAAAAVVAKKRK